MFIRVSAGALLAFALWNPCLLQAADIDEFKVKRQEVFEFSEKPSVKRDGDKVTITFASKDYCDATVAVENPQGKIVRHLASGVLGPNAPEPFQKGSLSQAVVWDCKDDQGAYVKDLAGHTVRVSLGLKPQFERTLFWEPKKRWSVSHPLIQPAPEGVYVFDNGNGVAQLRLFDREGNYVKTLYPFPADKLDQVKGLNYHRFPQLEKPVPLRRGYEQATLLSSGTHCEVNEQGLGVGFVDGVASKAPSYAANSLAVCGDRIALAHLKLNRLCTDGSTGGLPLEGPEILRRGYPKMRTTGAAPAVGPSSAAFSPDGRRLYLAGYNWTEGEYPETRIDCLSGVAVMDYAGSDPPKTFLGTLEPDKRGAGQGEFNCATSVAVDKQGRVYVTDYINDRVQVFSPDGKFLKAMPVHRPALVNIHPKTQEIYVFSWFFWTMELDKIAAENERKHLPQWEDLPCRLYKFGPYENPQKLAEYPLPLPLPYKAAGGSAGGLSGVQYWGAVDGNGAKTVIWLGPGRFGRGQGYVDKFDEGALANNWDGFGIQMLTEEDGKLTRLRDFGKETGASVVRSRAPRNPNQMLYVNPTNGKLYLHEGDSGCLYKDCRELLEIDPATGRIRKLALPFSAMDLAFDINGLLYLRTTDVVVRYEPNAMREVPWDYGQEIPGLSGGTMSKNVISGLLMPSVNVVCYHQGGMGVSPWGDVTATCGNRAGTKADGARTGYDQPVNYGGKPYLPREYPGRQCDPITCCVHIWDAHGKIKHEDAVGGLPQLDGVKLDRQGNIYVMACPSRLLDGKRQFNPWTSTLIKFKPKTAKIISNSDICPIPLSKDARPDGPPHIVGSLDRGDAWVLNAEWFYGGVSFAAMNGGPGGGCQCWSWAQFDLDLYARSFAPEPDLYSLAVLDSAGNLIMHIGTYGNVDDGKPLVLDGGPKAPRSIGGDEVGLFCAKFMATHTDHRLFIADAGNHRILSVKLDYHRTETVPLGDRAPKLPTP